ncbi:MAG TPA: GlxA family transcriptional regulator [Rhodospirillaceae bacterium]|nr:AraC family transcriptional regulator [Rhodospirillaceae bacterium]MBB56733.1 AraC family transcriptional regulator [Rhodospirillaceae bacterium]HAE02045.1 GlxA family transcriptional regulator [Rhodospirillaceae bacterium]|tara:strand:- start:165336 stop:166313 length:978 start_codon:yes stop_codon:yes gene_type:complete
MFHLPPSNKTERIGFLLLPKFSMLAFSAMLDPLRMANWLSDKPLYEWVLISRDGGPVQAANGVSVGVDHSLASAQRLPTLIVVASYDHEKLATPDILALLRRWSSFGTALGALDNGTFILASAGLLDGYRATAHWEMLESHIEHFPRVAFTQDLFVVDRDRFTAAGGTSGLDMMLSLLRHRHGEDLATKAADEFVYSRIREPGDSQRLALRERLRGFHPRLIRAIEKMEAALEESRPMSDFADAAGISPRELERQFRKWLKTTPAAYYRGLRLDRSRHLLRQTDLPIIEIAFRSGFSSAAHFSRSFSGRFGHPPSAERRPLPPKV